MGLFDYKNLDRAAAVELMQTSQKLAVYTNAASVMNIPGADALNWLGGVGGALFSNSVNIAPPPGWRELTPSELGLPPGSVDGRGYYHFASAITGSSALPGTGPQAKILGQFDAQGQLNRVCMAWCGTNDLVDVADYLQLNTGEIVPHMAPLLEALKQYSQAHGLSGSDVLVTGYSLGGGLTNLMAQYRHTLADGFYNDAHYVGHAAPVIYDNPDVIINMGYENDVVYRIVGNELSLAAAIAAGKPGLVNPDKPFASTADNVVLFNDAYASPLWQISPFSILNLPMGWYAHLDGVISNAVERIGQSVFYDYSHRDSTVIVDSLSALSRGHTWVEDKATHTSDHHGTPAWIIGNEHGNLLKGGRGGDYIDAGGGNDRIKTGLGADRVDGGTGSDTVILHGRGDDWLAYRLHDGTLMMQAKDGSGLKQLHANVEKIAFEGEWLSQAKPYDIGSQALEDNRYSLLSFWNRDIGYQHCHEGGEGADWLSGKAVFGRGGDDVLHAHNGGGLLHGGEGHDVLRGGRGHDELYGAEGRDILYAGGGRDTVYGGVGDDVFVFEHSGHTVVRDFNHYAGDQDRLLFAHELFSSETEVLAHAHQSGSDVLIEHSHFSLRLEHTALDDLQHSGLIGII